MIMGAQPFSGVLVRGSRRPMLNMMRRQSGLGYQINAAVASSLRRRRGLGQPNAPGCMSSSDFYSAIGQLTNCDPRDTSCVLCNQQKSDAVSNLVDSGCVAPGTPISFSCDTGQAATAAFMSNNPIAVNATVGSGSSAFLASGPTVALQQPYTAPSLGPCSSLVYFNGVCEPGFSTATQQQQANPVAQQTTLSYTPPPYQPKFPQPGSPTVVNPSPASTLTATGSSYLNALSLLSQANGTAVTTTGQSAGTTSTGDWFTDPAQEIIGGLPNWALLVIGAGGLFVVVSMAARR